MAETIDERNARLLKQGFANNPQNIQSGRAKGSKNRNTLAKRLLESEVDGLTYEEQITLAQLQKAHLEGDTPAYKAIMDSAYGPAQTNQTVEGDEHRTLRPLFGDKMDTDDITTDDSPEEDSEGNS